MRIGILTQPMHNNYGGLLQAFALQKVLKDMGHEVLTVDRKHKTLPLYRKVLSIIKRAVLHYVFGKKISIRAWMTKKEYKTISENNIKFIRNNISMTMPIDSNEKLKLLEKYKFDAYVVGSDQVWRPKYSPCLSNFFLDFIEGNSKPIKKIAYAASLGSDRWEFTQEQTFTCSRLAKQFDALSVREKSGVDLCQKYLEVESTVVLDPTMLLMKEDYIDFVIKEKTPASSGDLMVYILDNSPSKDRIIYQVAKGLKLIPFKILPNKKFDELDRKSIDECVYPSVTNWIRGFMDAKFIVTDSFHGSVFSIIFNKPFLVIENEERGSARFQSLLSLFKLEDRIIGTSEGLNLNKIGQINFEQINQILNTEREKSFAFLYQFFQ